jgi:ABC-type nitrate/sulfonate/bicarbonate transport system substrate-binding protein
VPSLRLIEFVPPALEAVAGRRGWLTELVPDLDTVRTRTAGSQRQRLMEDERDIGFTAHHNLIAWNGQGDDLCVVAQVERFTVLDFIVRDDIRTVGDLRGERLAVDSVDSGFSIVVRKLLADGGVPEGEYELHPAGAIKERFDAVVDGSTAGGLLAPPWSYDALDTGLRRLMSAETALPDLPGIVLVARRSRLDELREPIHAYLAALRRAAQWIAGTPDDEVLAVLVDSGFDARSAVALLPTAPTDLTPRIEAVRFVFDIRREVGLLPARAPAPESLLAPDAFFAVPSGP